MGCVGVSADLGFSAPAVDSLSLCGFKFPPTFKFSIGFKLPGFVLELPLPFPLPWITLNCDLANPLSAGWGGGRKAVFNADAFDECAPD